MPNNSPVSNNSPYSTLLSLAPFTGGVGVSDYAFNDSPVLDPAGNLYGAMIGGTDNDGTIYELPKGSNTVITLASFDGADGATPLGGVILDMPAISTARQVRRVRLTPAPLSSGSKPLTRLRRCSRLAASF